MASIILHDDIYVDGTVTVSDASDLTNLTDLRSHLQWEADAFGTDFLTIDAGASVSVDSIGIAGHNLFTADADVSVEYSSDDFSGDINEALAAFTPSSDKEFMKQFSSQSARYWRIKMVTAAIAPKIGALKLGTALTIPYFVQSPFDPQPENIMSSIGGMGLHHLGVIVDSVDRNINPTYINVLPSFIDTTFKTAWDDYLSTHKPFFFAWDFDNFPNDVFYVRIPSKNTHTNPYDPWTKSLSLDLVGVR